MSESKLIFKKMNEIMKDVGFVAKDKTKQSQGYKFRGIDNFINALHPALCKAGVFMVPECVSEVHELREVQTGPDKFRIDKHVHTQMKYTFFAEDGSNVVVGPIPSEGFDTGDKATNKALSAALKYALIQTFSVPTEDMAEADFESPILEKTKKDVKQIAPIKELVTPTVTPKEPEPPLNTPAPTVTQVSPVTTSTTPVPTQEVPPAAVVAKTKATFRKVSTTKGPSW